MCVFKPDTDVVALPSPQFQMYSMMVPGQGGRGERQGGSLGSELALASTDTASGANPLVGNAVNKAIGGWSPGAASENEMG